MSLTAVLLALLGVVAVGGALFVLRSDLEHDDRPMRRWIEGVIPLVGLVVLVVAAWAAR